MIKPETATLRRLSAGTSASPLRLFLRRLKVALTVLTVAGVLLYAFHEHPGLMEPVGTLATLIAAVAAMQTGADHCRGRRVPGGEAQAACRRHDDPAVLPEAELKGGPGRQEAAQKVVGVPACPKSRR
ncbi:hypothetical protein GCM10010250_67530 [Streptomyces althioticus]|nr:hypothetical protein GCM10010250_67530 [Streptomyces althioticus]